MKAYILPKYACRTDLTTWEKLRFSFESRLSETKKARAVYRYLYHTGPKWIRDTVEIICAMSLVFGPFFIAYACKGVSDKLFGDDFGESDLSENAQPVMYVVVLTALCLLHPLAWILVGETLIFSLWAWFFGSVMDEYSGELERAGS